MAEYLISLTRKDYKVAMLSRGYKRKSKGFVLADEKSTVAQLGDEPYQIHTKFPLVTVAVDTDRRHGIALLEQKIGPDLIILDDAFQHRRVKAGLNILLTAYGALYIDDWCLPTGHLRDNRREAKRADLIIVTKCPPTLSEPQREELRKRLKPKAHQQILFSYLEYGTEIGGSKPGTTLDFLKDRQLTLVTGIADPAPLTAYLAKMGVSYDHHQFDDHHSFTQKELQALNAQAYVLTTEKDYVRLKDGVDHLYYITVRHQFLGNGSHVLEQEVGNFMKRSS
tara:strand:- start:1159 stop:2001 length:843 start_codon:yes stop_codon:yes gene_type:complete